MKLRCGECKRTGEAEEIVSLARYKCQFCEAVNEVLDITIKSWVGFNFSQYLEAIKRTIGKDEFVQLAAVTENDIARGMLSPNQVGELRNVLKDNFDKGSTIREITDDMVNKVKVTDLQLETRTVPAAARAINIARSETVRVSNEGSRVHYKEGGVLRYRWVSTMSDRTCIICENLNGQIFDVNDTTIPPAHSMCRCTIIPITLLEEL